jgi:streptogramin lyase
MRCFSPNNARLTTMKRPHAMRREAMQTNRRRRRLTIETLESRRLLASIAEFPVPSPGVLPTQITAGPDGNLWFSEGLGNLIGMINPTTHVVTQFTLPGNYGTVGGITTGPDGNIWFTNIAMSNGVTYGAIGMISPTTDRITEYPENIPNTAPIEITAGPDGDLWFTDIKTNNIGIINPTTGVITQLPVPGPYGGAAGITTGPDGNIWVSLIFDNSIAMINPTTHAITEFPVPTAAVGPAQIAVGPDGNLWFTESYSTQIGVINPTTHVITEIPVSTDVGDITAGPDGNVWFTGGNPAAIEMINPTTYAITTFPLANAGAEPEGITMGPDGNLWFAATNAYQIGVLDPADAGGAAAGGAATLPTSLAQFGFTLSPTSGASAVGDASSSVTLSLGASAGGDTLSVSTGHGIATYSGLKLKKVGDVYELVASATTTAQARAARNNIAALRPILTEQVLTAGKGKNKHAIGVKVTLRKALDPLLADDIAGGSRTLAKLATMPVLVQVFYGSSPAGASVNLTGKVESAASGRIVVVAKP